LLHFNSSFSQSKKLDIRVISSLRVTPIYTSFNHAPLVLDPPVLMQQDAHLSGLSLGAGLYYRLTESFFLSYSLSGRIDQYYTDLETMELKRGFFMDHSLGVGRCFGKKKQFGMGVEVSFRNRNSEFSLKRSASGSPPYTISTYDFNFTTLDMPFFYRGRQFFCGITPTYSIKKKFAQESPFFLLILNAGVLIAVK
jgi:hypothetical protein